MAKKNKLYIFCGIPFSGKTTISKAVEKQFGYRRIDLDDIKFELFGKDIKDSDINQEGWDKIYQEMYKRIEEALLKGETVIHDTGNFTKHERDLVRKIAERHRTEAITVFVNTPKEVAKQRLLQNRQTNQRFDISDQDFESIVAEMEPPSDTEPYFTFNPDKSIEQWINKYFGSQN